ncbi:hypothetical protein [Streptosporangium longisporum]|uniref:Uncharacterized protein n=1 Tax=Streptosporangium longisporum TaxID=46187 RepID=A0ABP6KMS7_9ACTN
MTAYLVGTGGPAADSVRIVVDGRGPGGFTGPPPDRGGHGGPHHVRCPVAVVRTAGRA